MWYTPSRRPVHQTHIIFLAWKFCGKKTFGVHFCFGAASREREWYMFGCVRRAGGAARKIINLLARWRLFATLGFEDFLRALVAGGDNTLGWRCAHLAEVLRVWINFGTEAWEKWRRVRFCVIESKPWMKRPQMTGYWNFFWQIT